MTPAQNLFRRRLQVALAAVLIASGLGLFASVMHFVGMRMGGARPTWSHALWMELPAWFVWLALFPGVQWFARRYRFEQGYFARRVVQHLGFGLGAIAIHATIMFVLAGDVGPGSTLAQIARTYRLRLGLGLTTRILSYGAVMGIALARDYYERYQERSLAASMLSAQLAEAQLAALRMQIHPHFLFNTLHTVAMLIRAGRSDQAIKTVSLLGDLFRSMLDEAPPPSRSLREELDFIDRYLMIERVRFEDRLRVEIDIAPECWEARLPTLIVQPIIENAIRHGISKRADAGLLLIQADCTAEHRLHLAVVDDGAGLPPSRHFRNGVGLSNTRSRLQQAYGDDWALEIRAREPDPGTEVHLTIPFSLNPGDPVGNN